MSDSEMDHRAAWKAVPSDPAADFRRAIDAIRRHDDEWEPCTHVITPRASPGDYALCMNCGAPVEVPDRPPWS